MNCFLLNPDEMQESRWGHVGKHILRFFLSFLKFGLNALSRRISHEHMNEQFY